MYPYKSSDDDELTFTKGDIIYVVEFPDPEEQVRENTILAYPSSIIQSNNSKFTIEHIVSVQCPC